jgi:hypothetical protein
MLSNREMGGKNIYFANKEPFPPIKQKLHYFNLYKILW